MWEGISAPADAAPYEAEARATSGLDAVIARAVRGLARAQASDGHWCFELEADATIPSEYLLLRHYLGEPDDLDLEARIGRYLRRIQGGHGGWPLYHDGAFDLSASVKAYYALKIIGDDPAAAHMARAREAILAAGGAAKVNVFSRIQLALFGAGPWETVPEMPPELMLAPKTFPITIWKISYWARTVLVPLLVLMALRPRARNPRGVLVEELYCPGKRRMPRTRGPWALRTAFGLLDKCLRAGRGLWPKSMRARALKACEDFVLERLNGVDGLGAIYPAMANSVMMFDALGYGEDHPARAQARASLERLIVRRDNGEIYCQPCVSPIWDTALAAHAMLEAGGPEAEAAAARGCEWLVPRQELELVGDWAEQRPGVRPGGWAFQYNNAHYPDTDDTAAVVLAMDRARRATDADYAHAIERAKEWVEGVQSKGGGWGAFDADNTHYHLNHIPFADHGALLDPPTVDVTARCVGMLAQLGVSADEPKMAEAIGYLLAEQEADGSWFGRWGVNYIYGTWSALCALNAAGLPPEHKAMRRAADWLVAIQNADGGWGESCDSYKLDYRGYEPAPSTAAQTAWALIGLMAAGEVDHPAVEAGVRWLSERQQPDGLWGQEHYVGGGFPRVFYLRYHGYPAYFPLWAVARYRNLKRSNSGRTPWGM